MLSICKLVLEFQIYTDSAVAKLPAVQDYLTTLLEVCTSLESVYCTPHCKHGK